MAESLRIHWVPLYCFLCFGWLCNDLYNCVQTDAFNTHWPSAIRQKDYLSCVVSVSQSFFFLSSLRKEKKKYAKEYDTKKLSSLISRIKIKIGKFSTLISFYAKISQRLRSSWVNFKFRRCICSDAPSTNQVLSISLRTASRRWLKACSRFCLRSAFLQV